MMSWAGRSLWHIPPVPSPPLTQAPAQGAAPSVKRPAALPTGWPGPGSGHQPGGGQWGASSSSPSRLSTPALFPSPLVAVTDILHLTGSVFPASVARETHGEARQGSQEPAAASPR